jgi:Peptidase MA superfamily
MQYLLLLLALTTFDPGDFSRLETEHFIFLHRPDDLPTAERLAAAAPAIHAAVFDIIGAYPAKKTRVLIAHNTADYFDQVPEGYMLPDWSIGGAIPRLQLILLDPRNRSGSPPYDLLGVFTHEVSHIYLGAIAKGHNVPRILDEGLAMYIAREGTMSRFIVLASAALAGNLIPLGKLMRGFPYNERQAHLAYAQSYHFVNYLISTYGRHNFLAMLERIGQGQEHGQALMRLTGMSFGRLEAQWMKQINRTYAMLPIISSSSLLWVFAAMMVVVGFLRKRRENQIRLAEWEEEERKYYGDDDYTSDHDKFDDPDDYFQ